MTFYFDFDCTLTNQEILPKFAQYLDIEQEMATLLEITRNGFLDFESSLRLRIALVRELLHKKDIIQKICDQISISTALMAFVNEHPEQCNIVTGSVKEMIAPLVDKFHCPVISSEGYFDEYGVYKLSNILVKDKALGFIKNLSKPIVAIGDGANDVPLFKVSDISIAYGGVCEPPQSLLAVSNYITYSEDSLCKILNMLLFSQPG